MKNSCRAQKHVWGAKACHAAARGGAEAHDLKSLCRALGDVALEEIRPDHIEVYLAGKGPITATWERKYSTLKGFYRFAVARGYANCVPLPPAVPRPRRTFVPYTRHQSVIIITAEQLDG